MHRGPGFGGFGRPPKRAKTIRAPKRIEPPRKKNHFEAAQNQELALEALRRSLCLTLTYCDCYRVVEVHTVGITTAGNPAMNVYQVDGQTDSTPIPDWRLFCFDECFDVSLSDLPSSPPRPDYTKGAKQFRRIIAEF